MDKRILTAFVAAIVVLAVALCGCTGTSPDVPETTPAVTPVATGDAGTPAPETNVTETTPETNVTETSPAAQTGEKTRYIVGIDGDYKPYSWMTLDGKATGFDVESIQWIADEMGFEVEIKPMAWDGIIPALQQGKIDMVYSGMTISPERLQNVNFSKPYWIVNQAVAVREGSDLTIEDVKEGKVVMGVQRGCTAHTWIDQHLIQTGNLSSDDCKLYKNVQLALTDLQNKRVDAVMYDVPVIKDAIQGKPLVMLGEIQTDEEYGVAVRKDDNDLRATINEGLDKLMTSPKWDELKQKYEMA
ncbi:amino acid ABC transporter substrate-binding protein [Methanofollis aquaemaris]|uniref:Amino acid ABC transporter substrate-binding protein n=1 Tax=Methanofollis aquaemaris TaxID=126734 RepID=A0A8A3S678_9EURY|nr:ABC transporter substrate-binding protein [Methanofollis aquaemaris]QSZ67777.1 amino acid ABC transporter substrate-binding protein [Methanofollis aquaemaris]